MPVSGSTFGSLQRVARQEMCKSTGEEGDEDLGDGVKRARVQVSSWKAGGPVM